MKGKSVIAQLRATLINLSMALWLNEMLAVAYGGYREQYRGRPYPMDN